MTIDGNLIVHRAAGRTVARWRNGQTFAAWDRELSDAEVEALLRDPWAMFKPERELT